MTYKKEIYEFLSKYNMNFHDISFENSCKDFISEMEKGLLQEGSSLKMIPTYLDFVEKFPKNETVIALDAGGTNFRVAAIEFDENSQISIPYFEKYKMPGTEGKITADEFFDKLSDYVIPVLDYSDKIGFCFSYPTEMLPNKDGKAMELTKEVDIEGIEGRLIGQSLLDMFKKKGIEKEFSIVLLNDTVSTLLGGIALNPYTKFDGGIGFILGTGTNTCYLEKKSKVLKDSEIAKQDGTIIINIESGGFSKAPMGILDDVFDKTTINKDTQRFEKMISGAYQGSLFKLVLQKVNDEGITKLDKEKLNNFKLETYHITEFMDYPYINELSKEFAFEEEDRIKIYFLFEALIQRSAKLVSINLSAITIKTENGENPLIPVCIAAEGTTFYKSKLFKDKLDYYLNKYLNRDHNVYYEIIMSEKLNILGTAIAGTMK